MPLSPTPLLRCLVPFTAGITVAHYAALPLWLVVLLSCALAAALAIAEWAVTRSPARAIRLAWIPSLLLLLLCSTVGMLTTVLHSHKPVPPEALSGKVLSCRVEDITCHDIATELMASVTAIADSTDHAALLGTRIHLFLDHQVFSLTEGDVLLLRARFKPIANMGNPCEFDYRSFMARRGCFLTASLTAHDYRIAPRHTDDFHSLSLHARRHLVNLVLNSSLSVDAKHLVCTAILGDSSMISSDTRTTFSHAGIAHTLAISGLHMGIILALVSLLLSPLDRLRLRSLRYALTVAAMAAFLFVTGLSASAIRATIMAGMAIIATASQRTGSSLNALCLAAILILAFSPMAIFNVGFQLSFAAVAAILLLASKLNRVSQRHRLTFTLASWILATLIANLGCAVISAYYFHTLPLLSICANLVVVPLLPLFVATGLVSILGLSLGVQLTEVNTLLEWLVSLFHSTASAASQLPLGYIDNLYVSLPTVVLYYLSFALAVTFLYRRSFAICVCFLAACTAVVATIAAEAATAPREGLVVLNSRNSTPVLHFANGQATVWCTDRTLTAEEVRSTYAPFLAKYRINEISIIPSAETSTSPTQMAHSASRVMCGKRIVMASSTPMRYLRAEQPIACNYLIVTSRYYGKVADLLNAFSPQTIIITGALFPNRHDSHHDSHSPQSPAITQHIHNLSTQGAFLLKDE